MEEKLAAPVRLVLKWLKSDEHTRAGLVQIHGINTQGEPVTEEIAPRAWSWSGTQGIAITNHRFQVVTGLERDGFKSHDRLIVSGAECSREDISLLLGLWAGALEPAQARQLVTRTIPERFQHSFGLVEYVEGKWHPLPDALQRVSIPWNNLVLEGYLNYGFRSQAAALYKALMQAAVNSLKTEHATYQYYHPQSGAGMGQRNHLHGLPSPGLFLQIAGIHQIGENQVLTRDFNAFPFTVTVKYHGMTITSTDKWIDIVFAGGQTARVESPGFHCINLH
jgi:hypothetical protein